MKSILFQLNQLLYQIKRYKCKTLDEVTFLSTLQEQAEKAVRKITTYILNQ